MNIRLNSISMLIMENTTLNPKILIITPANNGNRLVRIFPAPDIPAYRVLFSVLDISMRIPFIDILKVEIKIPANKNIPGNRI